MSKCCLIAIALVPLAVIAIPTCAQSVAPPAPTPVPSALLAPTPVAALLTALPSPTRAAVAVPTAAPPATASAASAGGVVSTTVVIFQPAGITGDEQSGDCWTTSIPVDRPGAWRCRIGDSIQDPCFSTAGQSGAVICVSDPTRDGKGFKLNLTQPLPAVTPSPLAKLKPWTMQLADGTVCSAFQGTRFLVIGEMATYACSDRSVLAGEPKEGKVWTVKRVRMAADNRTPAGVEEMAVQTVWE